MKNTRTSIYRISKPLFYSRNISLKCGVPRSKWCWRGEDNVHGSFIKAWPVLQNANISTVAKQIQKTGELPPLPTEPVIDLPILPHQAKLRDENIVRDDIQATLEAHYAANVLAHGSIHVKLNDTSNSEPRRLAITPPQKPIATRNTIQPVGSEETREKKAWNNEDVGEPSELRKKLLQVDQSLDVWSRLDAEIRVFHEWIELTQEEHDAGLEIWSRFQDTVLVKFPHCKLQLHGSRSTGLARPFSDIDVRVIIPKLEKMQDNDRGPSSGSKSIKTKYISVLRRIGEWVRKKTDKDLVATGVRMGRYPVLQIEHRKRWHYAIQVAAIAGKPIEYNTEFVKYYLHEYPQIKSLYFLMRWWMEGAGIGDGTNGGASSYLTFNMILTSITHSNESFDSGELGKALVQFLRFWSTADYKKLGFAPDPARTFPKFAVNIVADNHFENLIAEDDTSQTSDPAEWSLEEPQAVATASPVTMQESDTAQTHPLDEFAMGTRDTYVARNNEPESDVYLDGIKFLTHQAKKLSRIPHDQHSYFLLQDPADPRNNVGRSFQMLPKMSSMMRGALKRLERAMKIRDEQELSVQSSLPSFLLESLVYTKSHYDKHPDLRLQIYEKKRQSLAVSVARSLRPRSPSTDDDEI